MKKIVIVKADTNDADYITEETKLVGWEFDAENLIKRVAQAIKQRSEENKDNRNWHNWENSEYSRGLPPEEEYEGLLTPEEIDIFGSEFMPYGEHGTHTIESIRIVEIASDTELL